MTLFYSLAYHYYRATVMMIIMIIWRVLTGGISRHAGRENDDVGEDIIIPH